MAELSEEHARLLIYSWARVASRQKTKPSLPSRVTTSRRGPLALDGAVGAPTRTLHRPAPLSRPPPVRHSGGSRLTAPPSRYMTTRSMSRQKLFRELPPASERPLDLVQKHIDQGQVTCAQLSNTMEMWPSVDATVKSRRSKAVVDSVHTLPGIQVPHRETIHLPSIVPHPSNPPLAISITYTRATKATPMPSETTPIPPVSIPTLMPPETTPTNSTCTRTSHNDQSSLVPVAMATPRASKQKINDEQPALPSGGLAPAAVHAFNTHKLRPIRSTTYLQGQAILTRTST